MGIKLSPLIQIVNDKVIQFGVFAEHLSIDEQTVPYFRRHSCEMSEETDQVSLQKLGYFLWW